MRTPTIRLVDFSGGSDFRESVAATENLIRASAARFYEDDSPAEPLAHVELVSTDDTAITTAALHAECQVLHVSSHMQGRGGDPAFQGRRYNSTDDAPVILVSDVAAQLHEAGLGIVAECLYADGCNSGTRRFVRAVSDCLEEPLAYISSRRTVTEAECTLFAANFYAAFLSRRGKGKGRGEHAFESAESAREAYRVTLRRECPFTVQRLEPSREAARAFQG